MSGEVRDPQEPIDPDDASALERLLSSGASLDARENAARLESYRAESWERVRAAMTGGEGPRHQGPHEAMSRTARFASLTSPRSFAGRWRLFARAVLAATAAALLIVWQKGHSIRETPTATNLVREYTTANGKRAEVTLSDGTRITLNVASRLRVPLEYGRTHRDVYLEGEARFVAAHDSRMPLTVHAGGAVARDLATVFNVRAYPGIVGVEVAVVAGRVAVGATSVAIPNAVVATAGEIADVRGDGTARIIAGADIDARLGWTRGVLEFDGAPLTDVLTELGRWYDLEFRISDPELGARRVSTSFTESTLAAEKLAALAEVAHATVSRSGRVITFSPAAR